MIIFIPDNLIDEFDTSESFNKNIFIYNDSIIIPYINLEVISDIGFLGLNKKDIVKFSCLIFTGLKSVVSTISDFKLSFSNTKKSSTNYIVCNNTFSDDMADELKVEFLNMYLYLPDDFNKEKNLSDNNINIDYFTKEKIPNEILELINLDDISMLKTLRKKG